MEKDPRRDQWSVSKKELLNKILKSKSSVFAKEPIKSYPREGRIPASFAQKRLWFLDQLYPDSPAYNVTYTIRLQGRLHLEAMKRSIQELINRHEGLRTRFIKEDAQPFQFVMDKLQLDMPCIDLTSIALDEREAKAKQLLYEDMRLPFDLHSEPLIRVHFIKLDEEDHYLAINIHHIVFDGWSSGVFFKELSTLYEAYQREEYIPLPELPFQYIDYTQWQQEWLQGEVLERQLRYWEQQLEGELPVLDLPYDRQRPTQPTLRGALHHFTIPMTLYQSLKELSQREEVSLYMTLLAAFKTLMYRYTRQEDLLIASPIANRTRSEWEQVVGFFANTLILRTDLSGSPSFLELLKRVRQVTLDAYSNQDVPFEQIVEKLMPNRDLSMNPMFQIMFNLVELPEETRFAGLETQFIDIDNGTTKFDFEVQITEKQDGIYGRVEYSTDLFDEGTMERMFLHYQTLLEELARKPDQSIDEINLLETEEQNLLLYEWNQTEADYPADQCLHHLFEKQVIRTPDEPAIIFEGKSITYRELNQRANGFAQYLYQLGVKPEIKVGVCLNRSLEMVVAVLGILKAGGAYVSLDPSEQKERLQHFMDDAQLSLVLTNQKLDSYIPSSTVTRVYIDEIWDELELQDENPDSNKPDHLIYIVYTSGTTGKPKGIAMTHRPLINLITWQGKNWRHNPKARSLQFSPLGFDMSCFEYFTTFSYGGTLVIPTEEERNDPEQLLSFLIKYGVQRAYFPYVALQQVAELALQSDLSKLQLREIVVAGEQLRLSPKIVEFLQHLDDCVLHNHYGPSEAHVVTSYPVFIKQEKRLLSPVGRPIDNTKIYILDNQRNPVPIGVPGEVYVAGVCLARGYINLSDITEERFVENPFTVGTKMYRTGDLARYLPDGNIQYMGRVDDQVKIRGYRVEPGEIEAVIQKYPDITEVIVVTKVSELRHIELVAYFIAKKKVRNEELRTYLLSKLPDYMVPVFYVQLDQFPLTSGGKINRRALPEPDRGLSHQSGWKQPETLTEIKLAQIWGEILGRTSIGKEDHFFQLGGHSLLATQLISRIRTNFQVEVPLRVIFELPKLKDLAKRIDQESMMKVQKIQSYHRSELNPVSYAQHRIWFLNQLHPESVAYNMPYAIKFKGNVYLDVMRQSIQELIDRHEGLRTNFIMKDDQPYQVIREKFTIEMPCVDLTHLPKDERESEAMSLLIQDAKTRFDLERDPLIRVKFVRISDDEFYFLVHFHHIIMDGWSVEVFFKELASLYKGTILNQKVLLPELSLHYVDYAQWQREWLQDGVLKSQMKYWEKQLSGDLPVLALPYDRPRISSTLFQGDVYPFTLPSKLHQKVKELSQQEEVSLYMLLLAAFKTLMYCYKPQEDLLVAAPIANRTHGEWDHVLGFFANTVILRTDLSGEPTFLEVLRRVRQVTIDAYSNQDVPFEKIVEKLMPERDVNTNPIFQVLFNYIESTYEIPFYGLETQYVDVDNDTAKFDLEFQMMETKSGIEGRIEFNTDLFDRTTIQRMMKHFQKLLEDVVQTPNRSIVEFDLLQEDERKLLLEEWNRTEVTFRSDQCLHQLFEEQAIQSPDEVAIRYKEQSITYQEVNQLANGLAQKLHQMGVGPEDRVGVCINRSIEMVVAVLAVLKAGGAYVPLDPNDHPQRLQYIVEDAQPSLVLLKREFDSFISGSKSPKVYIDHIWDDIPRSDSSGGECKPDQLMYLIYTSGSTGKPKGVALTHRSVVNLMDWQKEHWIYKEKTRSLQYASLSFDMSCFEIFTAFDTGSTLVIPEEDVRKDPTKLLDLLVEQKIERAYFPYVALQQLAEVANQRKELPLSLREIVVAGEQLNLTTQIVGFLKRLNGCVLHNHYGPSETHVVTSYPVWIEKENRGIPPIGRPIANTKVYILDQRMKPVPIGIEGELYIAGACLARGYFQQNELTNERFISNPFSDNPQDKLYKTGDLARYLPDGSIQFLGRVDNQVKIRGYRVEPGEIEVNMLKYPGVSEAAVIARETKSSQTVLAAYYVADHELDQDLLRTFLLGQLPDYMVPRFIKQVDKMPLTASGKIDRRTLSQLDINEDHRSVQREPQTEAEKKLVLIWEHVLERTSIGRDDHFFYLGGHSLLVNRVVSCIRRDFHIDVSLQLIFEAPILKDLAIRLEQLQKGNIKPVNRTIQRQPRQLTSQVKKQE